MEHEAELVLPACVFIPHLTIAIPQQSSVVLETQCRLLRTGGAVLLLDALLPIVARGLKEQ